LRFSVIGGDARLAALARALLEDGHNVSVYASAGRFPGGTAEDMGDSLRGADCVVLPLPFYDGEGRFNAPSAARPVWPEDVAAAIEPGQLVFAGMPDETFMKAVRGKGAQPFDYARREDFALRNAALTAEGAVARLIEGAPFALSGERCLVAGFGRIGRALSFRLRALGACVTVYARKSADRAEAASAGLSAVGDKALAEAFAASRVVVNTVPARIFGAELAEEKRPGAFLLDLASAPGGFDPALKAEKAPGLPGKTAPESAGRAILAAVYEIMEEQKREERT